MHIIEAAMTRSRTVILGLVTILAAGLIAYLTIPKEAEPDIAVPLVYVYIQHDGISPEDAERLLVRPMEQELRTIEGIKELVAEAFEGGASLQIEFDAGIETLTLRAFWPLRMRVSMSEIGSVIVIVRAPLPTGLG